MIRLPHGFGGLQVSGEAHGPFVMVTWLSYDGRLLETRAGLVAADARRWDEAERQFGIACEFAEQMRNRLVLPRCSRTRCRPIEPSGCPPTPLRRNASNARRRPKGSQSAPSAERPVTVCKAAALSRSLNEQVQPLSS